jgi:apolipoprotein N-acyltransferase
VTEATLPQVTAPSLPVRAVLGAVSGAGLALAFPPYDLAGGWVALPAFAGLIASHRLLTWRGGAVVGFTGGLVFFLILLQWLLVLGPDAWIILSLVCALFWAGVGALLPGLLARPAWVVTVPLLWVVMEALRERVPFGGFPWGRLAYAQAGTPLVGWAAIGGPAVATLVVALGGTALLAMARAVRGRRGPALAAAVAGVGALVLVGGLARGADWGGPEVATEPIAIVQGNVPRLGLDFNAQRRAVLDNHVSATEELADDVAAGTAPQPVAVIWPENSSDIDPVRNADAAEQIDLAADAIGVPILVGAVVVNPQDPPSDDSPGTILNVALVWDPETGPGDRYVKRHPVPFGEYLPFRDVLTRFITRFERVPRDFAAGEQAGFLQVGPVPLGVVICFEIAYDELVRDAVHAGGQVLVVQTNNATYGRTGQPEQQLAISRVQAVAAGRTTLVAATSGISAVIDPQGALQWRTDEFTADSTVSDVGLRTGLTPAMRLGALPEAVAALVLILVVMRPRRARRQSSTKTSSPSTITG